MKVRLEKSFPMPGSAEAAWAVLQDIDAVAGCMPGAKITERIDERHFKGQVGVKFGPANMAFRGDVEVLALDADSRMLKLSGKGTDSTGTSAAAMDLQARIEPVDAGSSQLVGVSEVSVSGKAATFGGRLMDAVAEQVLKQFAANFAARVEALATASRVEPPAAGTTATTSEAGGEEGRDGGAGAGAPGAASATASPAPASGAAPKPTASDPDPAPAASLDGFAFAWAVFKSWLRSLFGARRA